MRISFASFFVASLLVATVSAAGEMIPPAATGTPGPPGIPAAGAVKAIVVKSWGQGSLGQVWDHLNAHWDSYGTIPIFIDATTLHDVASFTLADLQNSGADVVIVSDPAGATLQWTAAEVAALATYANDGHALVGTFALLQSAGCDNRILAPLWGLRPDLAYTDGATMLTAGILAPSICLFSRITDPLDRAGWPFHQLPSDRSWDPADLAGASFVARSADRYSVVTAYTNGGLHATYISNMPEYQSGSDLEATQLLYNAIVCPFSPTPVSKPSWGRVKALYR